MLLLNRTWRRQPPESSRLESDKHLTSVSRIRSGALVSERSWTVNNAADVNYESCLFGAAVRLTNSGHWSRTNNYPTSGPLTIGMVVRPTLKTPGNTFGLWSLASSALSGGPYVLLNSSFQDLRIYIGGSYRSVLSGSFLVDNDLHITLSIKELANSAANEFVLACNGRFVLVGGFSNNTNSSASEYLGSGYSSSANGYYGVHFAGSFFDPAWAIEKSHNLWQLFEPRRIWVPQSAASGLPTLSLSTYKPSTLTSSGWTPRITAT